MGLGVVSDHLTSYSVIICVLCVLFVAFVMVTIFCLLFFVCHDTTCFEAICERAVLHDERVL